MVCEDHGELRRSRVSRETGLVERCKLWLTALGSHLPNGPGRAPGGDRWTARAARQGQHLPLIEAEGLIGRPISDASSRCRAAPRALPRGVPPGRGVQGLFERRGGLARRCRTTPSQDRAAVVRHFGDFARRRVAVVE